MFKWRLGGDFVSAHCAAVSLFACARSLSFYDSPSGRGTMAHCKASVVQRVFSTTTSNSCSCICIYIYIHTNSCVTLHECRSSSK